jgi:hypothetical protein
LSDHHVIIFISLKIILINVIHQGKEEDYQKRWTDEIEEVSKIMGIRNLHTEAKEWKECRRIVWEAKKKKKKGRRRRRRKRSSRRRRRSYSYCKHFWSNETPRYCIKF